MPKNQQVPNPPEHVIAAAERMLGGPWLSPSLRETVERNVERMRDELAEQDDEPL
jgi:hypothetical protein